jgi:serine phosphatase RsbU (regulator of sigma subunit)
LLLDRTAPLRKGTVASRPPADTVSGDYYDALHRDDGRLLLIVAGKSIPAMLLMATIQASLRTLAAAPVALEEVLLG